MKLSENQTAHDPFIQFETWYAAHRSVVKDYSDAFVLSTSGLDGIVSSRIVLLKDYGKDGFVFYTNYSGRKSVQLSENNNASMLFYWPESSQQVRIEGRAEKVADEISDRYFASRPRENRIGAWASNQDEIIPGREYLDKRFREFEGRFMGKNIPRPANWGGFRIIPRWFEFWQEGLHRLHDRIAYQSDGPGWKKLRLSP